MPIAKEQLRQMIADNDITNVGDIYFLFKESFKDILQEPLEAEMEASIGYEKNQKEEGCFPIRLLFGHNETPFNALVFSDLILVKELYVFGTHFLFLPVRSTFIPLIL